MSMKRNFFNVLRDYLCSIVLIINCQSIWMYIQPYRNSLNNWLLIVMVFIIVSGFLSMHRISRKILKNELFKISIIVVVSATYLIINPVNLEAFVRFIIAVLLIYILTSVIYTGKNASPFLFRLSNVIYVIAVISLFFWIVGTVFHIIQPTGNVVSTWTGEGALSTVCNSYYGIYFETQEVSSSFGILYRNSAFFSEAPMASYIFVIGFLIEFFMVERKSKLRVLILVASILSTFSTMGIIAVILSFSLNVLFSKPKISFIRVLKIIILPIVGVFVCLMAYDIISSKLQSVSGITRIDDIIAGFQAWKTNLLFGTGFGNMTVINSYMSRWRAYNTGYSNSLMMILAQGGILFGIVYGFVYAKCIIESYKVNSRIFSLFLVFALTTVFTIVIYRWITIFILCLFMHSTKNFQECFQYKK